MLDWKSSVPQGTGGSNPFLSARLLKSGKNRLVSIARGPFFVGAVGAALHGAACEPAVVAAPLATATAAPQPPPPPRARDRAPVDVAAGLPQDCGALIIERQRLIGRGAGEKHPRLLATESAIATICTEATRKDSLVDACAHLVIEHAEARSRYGPNHPVMQELEHARTVCPSTDEMIEVRARRPRPPPDCVALRAERDALIAAGKGPRHPRMIAAEARLQACR